MNDNMIKRTQCIGNLIYPSYQSQLEAAAMKRLLGLIILSLFLFTHIHGQKVIIGKSCTDHKLCAPNLLCNNYTEGFKKNFVDHKPFWPLIWNEYLSAATCFLGGIIASSAGLGGGSIYNPVLILVGRYPAQTSAPLSHVSQTFVFDNNWVGNGSRKFNDKFSHFFATQSSSHE